MSQPENQRVRVSKRMLKDALMDLLDEKEIGKIKISELCARAEINRATFYKYYGSQYDLLSEIESDFFADLNQFLSQLSIPGPTVLSDFLNYMSAKKDVFNILAKTMSDQTFSNHLFSAPVIQDIFAVTMMPDCSPLQEKYLRLFVSQGIYSVLREWINCGCSEPTEEIAEILHGFL